jgi:ferredoxin
MRVWVDPEACQGHTQCSFTAPAVFALRDEDGHAYTTVELVPAELEDLVRVAVDSCPEHAILLED